jgi:hypothetical protein
LNRTAISLGFNGRDHTHSCPFPIRIFGLDSSGEATEEGDLLTRQNQIVDLDFADCDSTAVEAKRAVA